MGGQQIKLVVALVLLGGASALLYRFFSAPRADGEDMPGGVFWMCKNPECRHEFNLPLAEMKKQMNVEGRVPCPKCDERMTKRGFKCPACDRVVDPVGHGGVPEKCQHCGEAIPIPQRGG